jgi:hypothetical protein
MPRLLLSGEVLFSTPPVISIIEGKKIILKIKDFLDFEKSKVGAHIIQLSGYYPVN